MINATKRPVKAVFLILCAFVSAAVLAGCGGASDGNESEDNVVRIGWLPGSCGRLYAAMGLDLFEKTGLNAKLIRFTNGPAMNGALQSKDIDLIYTGQPGFLVALEGGVDMSVVMVEGRPSHAYGLVASPDSGIESVDDLVGKTLGTSFGTTAWVEMNIAFEAEGVDPAAVNLKNLPTSAMVPAVERGDVDAVWTWAPHLYDVVNAGGELIVTDDKWVTSATLWAARDEWLADHSGEVVKFIETMALATDAINEQPDVVADAMAEKIGIDKSSATKMLETIKFPSIQSQVKPDSPISLTSPKGLSALFRVYINWLTSGEYISDSYTDSEITALIDPSFLEAYLKQTGK